MGRRPKTKLSVVMTTTDIREMTPQQIEDFQVRRRDEVCALLKAKWMVEAEEAGVPFGAVMLFKRRDK